MTSSTLRLPHQIEELLGKGPLRSGAAPIAWTVAPAVAGKGDQWRAWATEPAWERSRRWRPGKSMAPAAAREGERARRELTAGKRVRMVARRRRAGSKVVILLLLATRKEPEGAVEMADGRLWPGRARERRWAKGWRRWEEQVLQQCFYSEGRWRRWCRGNRSREEKLGTRETDGRRGKQGDRWREICGAVSSRGKIGAGEDRVPDWQRGGEEGDFGRETVVREGWIQEDDGEGVGEDDGNPRKKKGNGNRGDFGREMVVRGGLSRGYRRWVGR